MDELSTETLNLDESRKEVKFEAKKEWKLLKNVLKASFLLKHHDVRIVCDLDELIEEVKSSPTKVLLSRAATVTSDVISDHRATEKLFFYIQRSSQEDLVQIDSLIENNPRKFTRSKNDPDAFINKANISGIRPIYEACKNGYVNTVQLLLDHGANPHLLSGLSAKDLESPLQVACRWNHINVIKCLLLNSKWTTKEVKCAMKLTKNSEILAMLKLNIPGSTRSCF